MMQSTHEDPPPPSLYRVIYAQIEGIGWEKLLCLEDDLSAVSFKVIDKKGRVHTLETTLSKNYPESQPSISAHLSKLQEFWSTMDVIDRNFCFVDPKQPSNAATCRQINIGNGCHILLSIYAHNPRSLPECRFFGPDTVINPLWRNWKKNGRHWKNNKNFDEKNNKNFDENHATLLECNLPKPPTVGCKDEEQTDCGIRYAQRLPIDDELGINSGATPDYTCENPSCSKTFHTV